MAFIAILRDQDAGPLQIVARAERPAPEQRPSAAGVFIEEPSPVVFTREVHDPAALLSKLADLLATSRVAAAPDCYDCPVPVAIRAIEVAAKELWPTRRLRCPECQDYFAIPWGERRRMYLACPRCHNPMLNPGWDSA